MPSFTPKALAAELAKARLRGICEASDLLANLGAVSASVAAGAIAGLTKDAQIDLEAARGALAAEVADKEARATGQETLA